MIPRVNTYDVLLYQEPLHVKILPGQLKDYHEHVIYYRRVIHMVLVGRLQLIDGL